VAVQNKAWQRPGTWRPSTAHHVVGLNGEPEGALFHVSDHGALRDVFPPSSPLLVLSPTPHRRNSCADRGPELYRDLGLLMGGFLLRRRSFCIDNKPFCSHHVGFFLIYVGVQFAPTRSLLGRSVPLGGV
jgi:hypothetical protein